MSDYQQNPLIPAILAVLKQNAQQPNQSPFGIHHLLASLGRHPCFAELDDGELGLFKKNFLMMNGLYQLQRSLWEEGSLVLSIATLDIQLLPLSEWEQKGTLPDHSDPMRDYYLDWQHYYETTEEDVAALLASFWLRQDGDARQEALTTLQLSHDATPREIKQRYQKLAQEHHPDRGGDQGCFMEIRAAYELLKA
ncbi:MAG: molecular chaperone [Pseudomonadales bacterium]|nr:molecular chaperone [Pseudomonadales bacterium]